MQNMQQRLRLRRMSWEFGRLDWRETFRWFRRSLAAILGLSVTAGFVWLWWKGVPALYQDSGAGLDARAQAVTGTRTGLLIALAGAGAVGALWLNHRTFRITQLGHLTDRYAKAVEQLGSDTVDVRLGGIYALEQLAVDSYRDRDQATITEVLSAFVRIHSDPSYQRKLSQPTLLSPPQPPEEHETTEDYVDHQTNPPDDVQAAVTVLGRLPDRGVVIRGNLYGAYLRGADLIGARLKCVNLKSANLWGAYLIRANLTLAELDRANLTDANLIGAKLICSYLKDVNLQGADLTRANLKGANLQGANLKDADLTNTNLASADLTRTENLTQSQLDQAKGNAHTILPDGIIRPNHWA